MATGDDRAGSFVSATRVVAGLTLVSRVLGLARDMVCSRVFGVGPVWSSFALAFLIPNLFRRLFGEGALSAAFIPKYTQLLDEDPQAAHRFARLVLIVAMVGLTAIVLVGEAVLGLLLISPIGETGSLTIRLAMIMLPYMPLICAVALLGGMLQTHGKFMPTAGVPIVLNVCIITAALLILENIWAVSIAVLVAGVLQVAWSVWALRGAISWRGSIAGAGVHVRSMLYLMAPMVLGLGALQINAFLDGLIAGYAVMFGTHLPSWLGGAVYPLDDAANSVLFYAQRLYQFPLGVFGIAVATAIYPSLSRLARDIGPFTNTLRRGLRLSLFIGLPASVGLVLVDEPLAATLFLGGKFGQTGLERVATVLGAYATAVWAYSMIHVLTRAFYALGDSKTPVKIAVGFMGLNIALNVTLIWPFAEAGLAWSTAICAILQTAVLVRILHRRLAEAGSALVDAELLSGWVWTIGLSVVMGAAVFGADLIVPGGETWRAWAMRLAVGVVMGGVVYSGAAVALKRPEARWLLSRRGE
ncbi:MAG: murein biosynthesis integral membrane protein MurJ [Phycisphaerales bacterium]|nr:murein biosynthesis integral membrane protein MurJ [Phycisphaerales bacterium]